MHHRSVALSGGTRYKHRDGEDMGAKALRIGNMQAIAACVLMSGTMLLAVLALAASAWAQDTSAGDGEGSGWLAANRGASLDPPSEPERPANPRQAEEDLAGASVDAQDTNGNGVVDLATIQAEDCSVAPAGATLTIQDGDGTTGLLEDGANVEITATETEVTIVGTGPDDDIVFDEVGGSDDAFSGDATVLSSTGIECGEPDGGGGGGDGDGGDDGDGGTGGAVASVCQNVIASVGDINQAQTSNTNAATDQYSDALAEVAREQGVSITQANECLNGAAGTGGEDTSDDTGTDGTGGDNAGSTNTPEDVLSATIPDQKVLANTGGPAALLPALGLLLVSSLALGHLLRR